MARDDYDRDGGGRGGRDRGDRGDKPSSYPASFIEAYGRLVEDPVSINGGGARFRFASNYVNNQGEKGTHWHSVVCFQNYAKWVLDKLAKGDLIMVKGRQYGHTWRNKDDVDITDSDIVADFVAEDNRWYGSDRDGDDSGYDRGSRGGRDRDQGREERGSRERSSRSDDDGDRPRQRSERSERSSSRSEDDSRDRDSDRPRSRSSRGDDDGDRPRQRSERTERSGGDDGEGAPRERQRRESRVARHGDAADD